MNFLLSIDWNFNPDLFKLGSFPIKYYSLMYVLAFVIGLQLMKKIYIKDSISLEKLDSIFIYTVIAMLIGARVGHYLFYEEDYTLAEVFLPLKISDAVKQSTVYTPKGAWLKGNKNTINALIPGHKADIAGGACYNDARVSIEGR